MPDVPAGRAFAFAFEPGLDRWARRCGVLPTRSFVTLDRRGLEACFGPWRMSTTWANVESIERTGPYARWKVAGPARLSLADRGLTFAATSVAGVCLQFRRPIPGLEPLGLIRHPSLTLGVEDVDGFVELAERFRARTPSDEEVGVGPAHPQGGFAAACRAVVDWARRDGSVEHDTGEIEDIGAAGAPEVPWIDDVQLIERGAGPAYHRRYAVVVRDGTRSLDEAVAEIRADPNVLADTNFSPFTKLEGELGTMVVGDRYLVEIAGPWKGAVEITAVDAHCVQMCTLTSHMEAGVIEFRFDRPSADRVSLTIESWARSGDRTMDLFYDKLGVARAVQGQMWVIACERFAELVGGTPDGPVRVTTERSRR